MTIYSIHDVISGITQRSHMIQIIETRDYSIESHLNMSTVNYFLLTLMILQLSGKTLVLTLIQLDLADYQ